MKLRHYQQDAVDAVIAWIRKSTKPCCVEAPTGCGKSHVIAAIAHWINKQSKKKVLVIAPTGELVEQDYEKYLATGEPASMFSASVGRKELRHHVVFGSPLTVANSLNMFSNYAAVLVDECFHPDTMITTESGKMKISDPLLKSKRIACLNENTGSIEFDYPAKVWNNGTKNVSLIKHEHGEFSCTDTHKIYVNGSWKPAIEIKQGEMMTLLDLQSCVMKKLLRASAAVAKELYQTLLKKGH